MNQMAEVSPFRGIRYNTEKITDLSKVVVPPFDVISREEQQSAYATHPNNMIRLELNRGGEEAGSGSDPHGLAAGHFHAWRSEGILVQDRKPAFYLTALVLNLVEAAFVLARLVLARIGQRS